MWPEGLVVLHFLPGASCPAAIDERGLWALIPVAPRGRSRGGSRGRPAWRGSCTEGVGELVGYRLLGGVRRSKRPGKSPLLLMYHWTGKNYYFFIGKLETIACLN